jgi:hypothetical protein
MLFYNVWKFRLPCDLVLETHLGQPQTLCRTMELQAASDGASDFGNAMAL